MKTILVATDLSARSDRAVLRAAHLAETVGASLRILHVIDDEVPAAFLQTRSEAAEQVLAAMVADHEGLSALAPTIHVEVGHLDKLLPKIVAQQDVDLVVVGSHRNRGFGELLGAPTLSRLLRGLDVPVLVSVARPEVAYEAVSVGWDDSDGAEAVAQIARRMAPTAEITLVHAWQEVLASAPYAFETGGLIPKETQQRLQSDVQRAAVRLAGEGLPFAALVAMGPPGHVLRTRAEGGQADLIAVGRHARSGLARLILGATAEDLALSAPCDVLIASPS
ncbi:hypothetical protein JANAI62_27140 [Jannaschia pagri]|uniref:UspA domain-containing protein n=1 Tax=Jannaschia pagri TaxID=2829797 RepID=A0ABQ4NP16_9RHOB|nr:MULTISPECIES: universal stress protein [unclassified Jannaschia]GIT92257.1 hypothetical protein JANAI61_27150 [Jannaschia sp. AI_61]GIT96091.1 hypothetical protein JANAI62_27140 [Jannaschia sp. AI_62]